VANHIRGRPAVEAHHHIRDVAWAENASQLPDAFAASSGLVGDATAAG
jgi:hypothetical protein